jgi:hypothetical protein
MQNFKEQIVLYPFVDQRICKATTINVAEYKSKSTKKLIGFLSAALFFHSKATKASIQLVQLMQNALDGKVVDWPMVFRNNLQGELHTVKTELQGKKVGYSIYNCCYTCDPDFICSKELISLQQYGTHVVTQLKRPLEVQSKK